MNRRMVLYMVGQMVKLESALMVLPLIVSIVYQNKCVFSLLIAIAVALVLGFFLTIVFKPSNHIIYAKEGFVIVALSWLTLSLIGALPFTISGEIPNYIDSFFEFVSKIL